MKRLIISAFVIFGLSGCAMIQRQAFDHATQQAQAIANQCKAMKTSGEFEKWVQISDCKDDKIREIYTTVNYPNMDLINLLLAEDRVIYEKIDHNKITQAEGELEIAQAANDATNQLFQRRSLIIHNQAAIAATYNSITASQPHTCTGSGSSVTCY